MILVLITVLIITLNIGLITKIVPRLNKSKYITNKKKKILIQIRSVYLFKILLFTNECTIILHV